MEPLELIVKLVIVGLCVNTAINMKKTKKWINSHNIEYSFYEKELKEKKNNSILSFVNYYTGMPGRKFAHYCYSKKRLK